MCDILIYEGQNGIIIKKDTIIFFVRLVCEFIIFCWLYTQISLIFVIVFVSLFQKL